MAKLDVQSIRKEFPTLHQVVNGHSLIYLDSAATTHKPISVLEAVREYNEKFNANPHRGAHYLGIKATELYEGARDKVRQFIGASSEKEIVFTKNATEALNLVAYSYGMHFLQPGDEIVLCISEHHSNLVPWQQVAKRTGVQLKYLYLGDDYSLSSENIRSTITERTKIVGIAHMSNVLGSIYPIKEIAAYAHHCGAVMVVDGAQSVPHLPVDVQDLDADFFVFSGHKMLGPTGIGVLYGKEELLEAMPPFLMGGDMIEYVEEQATIYAELPHKFEAGTPNVEGAVGLAAAIDYLEQIGLKDIHRHEQELTEYALEKLRELPYIQIVGPNSLENRGAVISFTMDGCHPHDVATIMDSYGIALRAGHHCAQPLMHYLKVPAASRISLYLYNTLEEIDAFIRYLPEVRRWLGYGS